MKNYILEYENYLKIQGKAEKTITRYSVIISKFLLEYPEPEKATPAQIITFMLMRGASRTIKQAHGAMNLFFVGVLRSHVIKKIPQPKVSDYVPNILSQTEIIKVLSTIKNIKHHAIILLIYSCALRIGETLSLKIEDISKTENKIKIVGGKGGKDAYVPIPENCKNVLRNYYKNNKKTPEIYLFEGVKGVKYSRSSVRKTLNKALKNAGIKKHIRIHDLRHSRATHLLENGMDSKMLKDILRHKKMETTEKYLHLTTSSLEKAMQLADINMNFNSAQTTTTLKAA